MNLLITPDVYRPSWAIGNIVEEIVKHQRHRFNFFIQPIHPRGVAADVAPITHLLKNTSIDLWHAHYWHSADQAMDICEKLKTIPKLLTHHNHYQLEKSDWRQYDALTIATKWGENVLKSKHNRVFYIPYGIDLDRFSYIDDYNTEGVIGYIGRGIEHKNLAKITEAAFKLGHRVKGSGYIDKPDYWKQVPHKEVLEFHGNEGRGGMMPQKFKDELYKQMTIFVMYSTGEKETGTMPLLEAMARGIPVLATRQGMARDLIIDGENGILFEEHEFEEKLKMLMEDKELRQRLREKAWETIKAYPWEKISRTYARAYYATMFPAQRLISVIIPTHNRADNLLKSIMAIEADNYQAKEIIVVDDGSADHTPQVITELKKRIKTPLIYLKTNSEEYGLAKARNMGILEALGEQLVFLDDRLILKPDMLEKIATYNGERIWYWGGKIAKGHLSTKREFVENFSWCRKKDIADMGLFNERITAYGGMSQEIRERAKRFGVSFQYAEECQAEATIHAEKKRSEIWKGKLILNKMYE